MTIRTPRRSWIRRATFAAVLALCSWLGSGQRAAVAAAPPGGGVLLRLTATANLGAVVSSLERLGLEVRWVDTTARLLVVDSPVLSAASIVAVLQLPARLLGIQALETNLLCAVGGRHGGSQSQAAVCSDELVFSSMPYQPGLGLVGAMPPATGSGPIVAVLDGGFSLRHEALPPHAIAGTYDTFDGDTWIEDEGDGIDGDHDGEIDDTVGHGTATAALLRVTAPSARLFLVRILDDEGVGTFASLAAGLDAAIRSGAQVINVSAGSAQASSIAESMLKDAAARGIAVICAAGNDAGAVHYPARSAYAYAVAGCDADRRFDPDSNFGTAVDLAAPSVRLIAPSPRSTDGYATWYGTSFAAPITSGCVAQLLTAQGGKGRAHLQRLLGTLQPWADAPPGAGPGILDLAPLRTW
jgi:subtilisin family serine protease